MNNMTFMELMSKGGWVMWVMFFASILIFTFLLERIWAFSKIGGGDGALVERVKQYVRQGQIKEAIALCDPKQPITGKEKKSDLAKLAADLVKKSNAGGKAG